MFKRIVVGLDGSDHARSALDIAIDLAKTHRASLVILHALSDAPLTKGERVLAETEYGLKEVPERPPMATVMDADTDPSIPFSAAPELPTDAEHRARIEIAQVLLEDARQNALQQGVQSVDIRVETGDPAKVILDAANSEKADLIVIGSRGFSDLKGLVFGSTSHKVAHLAACRCLTVS